MPITPDDMLLFYEVATAASVTAAAKRLGLPKSTVSRRLARHEQAFGARLLNRTTRRVTLTSLGEAYLRRCIAVAREVGEARTFAETASARLEGSIRLSMTAELGLYWLAPFLAAFSLRHPDINLHFDFSARRVDLVAERFDVVFRVGRLQDSSLVSRKVTTIDRALYASPGYVEERGRPQSPADLAKHRFVMLEAHTARTPMIDLLAPRSRITVPIRGSLVSNSLGMVRGLTVAGGGIGALPERMARDDLAAKRLMRILPDWRGTSLDIHCVFQTRKLLPAATRTFVDEMTEWVATENARYSLAK